MPRIPSAANVKSVGASVSRLPSVRAGAEDFGLATARGLAAVSGGLGDLSDRLRKEAQKKAPDEPEDDQPSAGQPPEDDAPSKEDRAAQTAQTVRLATAQNEARVIGQTLVDDMKRGAASPALARRGVVKRFDKEVEKVGAELPPDQQRALQGVIAPIRQGVALRAGQRAHNQSVEGALQDTQALLQSYQALALRDPRDAKFLAERGRALLRSHVETGALTPKQFAAQEETFRRGLYTAVLRGQPAIAAVVDLEEGVYDDALNEPELKQLLLTESLQRLENEQAQVVAGANWVVAQARRGLGPGALDAEGVLAEPQALDRVARARSELETLRYAPEAVLREGLAELPSAREGEEPDELHRYQEEFRVQSEEMLRQRLEDPAGYVMGLPAVTEAFAAAEKDPALLPKAVAERLAAQEAMGLTPDQRNALTEDERRQLLSGIKQLAPQQRLAALEELGKLYGDQSGAVLADLQEAGLSIADLLAADPSGGPEVSGQLAQAAENQGEAKSGEGDVIGEAAERLMAEGLEARGDQSEGQELEDMSIGRSLRLPVRKPRQDVSPSEVPKHVVSLPGGQDTTINGLPVGHGTARDVLESGLTEEQRRQPFNQVIELRGSKQDQMATIFALAKVEDHIQSYELPAELIDEAHALTMDAFNIQDILRTEGMEGLVAFRKRLGTFEAALRRHFQDRGNLSLISESIDQLHRELVATPLKNLRFLNEEELWQAFFTLSGFEDDSISIGTIVNLASAGVDIGAIFTPALRVPAFVFSMASGALTVGQEGKDQTRKRVMREMYERGMFPEIRRSEDLDFWSSKF